MSKILPLWWSKIPSDSGGAVVEIHSVPLFLKVAGIHFFVIPIFGIVSLLRGHIEKLAFNIMLIGYRNFGLTNIG
ncbi:MAG: hypothetical protein PHE49_01100 [bacterium]|nr:hypothetical protein [bacterium]